MIEISRTPQSLAAELDKAHLQAISRINDAFERKRSETFTSNLGMDWIYIKKETEARRYLATPQSELATLDVSLLDAEALMCSKTIRELAEEIVHQADARYNLEKVLEPLRHQVLTKIKKTKNATDIQELEALLAQTLADIF